MLSGFPTGGDEGIRRLAPNPRGSNPLVTKPKKNAQFLRIARSFSGGDEGIRTPDLLHAKQALSQLSHTPRYSYIISQHFKKIKYIMQKNQKNLRPLRVDF